MKQDYFWSGQSVAQGVVGNGVAEQRRDTQLKPCRANICRLLLLCVPQVGSSHSLHGRSRQRRLAVPGAWHLDCGWPHRRRGGYRRSAYQANEISAWLLKGLKEWNGKLLVGQRTRPVWKLEVFERMDALAFPKM